MKMLKRLQTLFTVSCFLLLLIFNSSAQGVGINATETAPHASALLDLSAEDKGFLITRADTLNIVSPAFGLMTLAPLDSCLYIYNGTEWLGMGGGGSNCSCNCVTTPSTSTCESFTDNRDGITYGAVQIGDQCWMSENLNYIPNSGNSWCYDYDPAKCNTLGRYYDWPTAVDGAPSSNTNPSGVKGVCPAGWHLPSDEEWKELEMYLGMSQTEVDKIAAYRGTNEADALKAQSWGGSNSSGFTALPGGLRNFDFGNFDQEGTHAYWWTSTESTTNAYRRSITSNRSDIYRGYFVKKYGYSVRCVKD